MDPVDPRSGLSRSMGTFHSVVTGIHEHPRRRGRFAIQIDGEDAAVVGVETIAALSLGVGHRVTPDARHALDLANRQTALFDRALNLLAVRGRSTRDLRTRLRRTDAEPQDIDWVVDRLLSLGYLNDEAYARQLARSRMVGQGVSKRRVQQELYRRGVSRELATEATNAIQADAELDEYSSALLAAGKRVPLLAKLAVPARRRRLYAFLTRRGFDSAIVGRVVREMLAQQTPTDPGSDGEEDR